MRKSHVSRRHRGRVRYKVSRLLLEQREQMVIVRSRS